MYIWFDPAIFAGCYCWSPFLETTRNYVLATSRQLHFGHLDVNHGTSHSALFTLSLKNRSNCVWETPEVPQTVKYQAISLEELLRKQSTDDLCQDIFRKINESTKNLFSTEALECEEALCLISSLNVQVDVTKTPRELLLGMRHYAKLSGHPSKIKMYKTLR